MKKLGVIIFFFSFAGLNAQSKWPIWFIPSSDTINGLSIGLIDNSLTEQSKNYKYQRNGIRIELIGLGIGTPFYDGMGSDSIRLFEINTNDEENLSQVNGVNISTSGTISHEKINGLSFNGLSQVVKGMNGLSASTFLNDCFGEYNGVQISFINHSVLINGAQLGGFNNGFVLNGLQIGLLNRNNTGSCVQIGLININKKGKGFQFGLWNISSNRQFPIINW